MKAPLWFLPAALLVSLALFGCQGFTATSPKTQGPSAPAAGQADDEGDVQANLAKLTPEDRKLAEEQGFCAVQYKNPLGSMGVPVKVLVKDQPVFLCCAGCRTKALAHADRTLAKVKELKEPQAGAAAK